MMNAHSPIAGLIAELEACLGRVDASGQALAGAYLSSAIDSLKSANLANLSGDPAPNCGRKSKLLTFH